MFSPRALFPPFEDTCFMSSISLSKALVSRIQPGMANSQTEIRFETMTIGLHRLLTSVSSSFCIAQYLSLKPRSHMTLRFFRFLLRCIQYFYAHISVKSPSSLPAARELNNCGRYLCSDHCMAYCKAVFQKNLACPEGPLPYRGEIQNLGERASEGGRKYKQKT
jgi:hypothetical protein